MSPNLESPLKSQVPALLLRRLFGAGSGARRDEAAKQQQMPVPRPSPPPAGRRRVFVQTESGCVLGMDLDRGDNAHTVKRRLQLALNVPTGGTSLTFGDRVLENDLSSVRHDSPLLLTRNSIHRSCSTPCLCPVSKDFEHNDSSGLVEILGSSSGSVKLLARVVGRVRTGGTRVAAVAGSAMAGLGVGEESGPYLRSRHVRRRAGSSRGRGCAAGRPPWSSPCSPPARQQASQP